MNDEVIPLRKVHEYFQGASDETIEEDAQRTDDQQPIGPERIGEQKAMDPRPERMQAAENSGSIRTIADQRLRQELQA
jgi:hypothetical protein